MKKPAYLPFLLVPFLVLLFALVNPVQLSGQSKAVITNVDFTVEGNQFIVTYDILKAKSGELFNIRLVITAVTGKSYNPVTMTGDVGDNVTAGKGKRIVWDLEKDNVFINEEIFVEVKSIPRSGTVVTSEVQPPVTEPEKVKPAVTKETGNRLISKGGAIGLSAIVPGLGINKMKGGGAYALLSLPVYGAAAGGLVFMLTSNSAYNKYKDATTAADRDNYFDKARKQQNLSKILFISAGAVWAINMIWTIATPNRPSPKYSFGATVDPWSGKPLVTFNYKF